MNINTSFKNVVNECAHDVAIRYAHTTLTYAQLDTKVETLSAQLASRNVQGHCVGVSMQRSPEWVVAILAILRAGAAYVPLDPVNPIERLEQIKGECGVTLIITDGGITGHGYNQPLQESHVDKSWAYVLYTSGTTGRPKGVAITHEQVMLNIGNATRHAFHARKGDRILQMASTNFLASVFEVFLTVLTGYELVIVDENTKKNPRLLASFINDNAVAHLCITSTQLSVMPQVDMPSLRTIAFLGEAPSEGLMHYWLSQGKNLCNMYGFTECAPYVAFAHLGAGTPANDIGNMADGITAWVLNADGEPVGDGIEGELYVGGLPVGNGYICNPELSAARFDSEGRFRTGDMVKRLPNGHYLYLGRKDNQLKINGMRVETSEIETVINAVNGVTKVVVIPVTVCGLQRLAAFIAVHDSVHGNHTLEAIKTRVAKLLPHYMHPTYYIIKDTLPLTINGKIDRHALSLPSSEVEIEKVLAHATPAERTMAYLWQSVLGTAPSSLVDTFLSLGGDSMSLIHLAEEIDTQYAMSINLSNLHLTDTLATFTRKVEEARTSTVASVSDKPATAIAPTDGAALNSSALPEFMQPLVLDILNSESSAEYYKLIHTTRFHDVDANTVERAWNCLVREHSAMRMVVSYRSSELHCSFAPFTYSSLTVTDVTGQALDHSCRQFAAAPLSVLDSVLWRACLFRVDDGTLVLCLVISHLATDGISLDLMDQLLHTYTKAITMHDDIHAVGADYSEYLRFKNTHVSKEEIAFWTDYTGGAPAHILPSAADAVSPMAMHEQTAHISVPELADYCRKHRVTTQAVVQTLYGYAVARCAHTKDFVMGFALNDRVRTPFRHMLGYMVELVPFRMRVDASHTFGQSVQLTASVVADLMKHDARAFQFARLHDDTSLQVVLAMEVLEPGQQSQSVPPFDMILFAFPHGQSLSLTLQYNASRVADDFAQRVLDTFLAMLDALLRSDLHAKPMQFLLSDAEVAELIALGKGKVVHIDPHETIVTAFRRQAQATPDAIAVAYADKTLTYRQLNELTDRLACHLIHHYGVDTEHVVGVLIDRSELMAVYPLAIMKAGAAYMPLDFNFPQDRLLYMCSVAHVELILTEGNLLQRAMPDYSGSVFAQTSLSTLAEAHPLPASINGSNASVVLYTSGSTGRPKGVVLEHHSIVNFCHWMMSEFNLTSHDKVLAYANFGFDAHMIDLYPTLLAGATVHIASSDMRYNLNALGTYINEVGITVAFFPTQVGHTVATQLHLPALRLMSVGGEKLKPLNPPHFRMYNGYGPTECTIYTTCFSITQPFTKQIIGRPLHNVSVFVVDAEGNLLPRGMEGELVVCGEGVARGYLSASEHDNARFFSFRPAPGMPLCHAYRTGDSVRWRTDGTIEYVSRLDSQVKLRGLRIELHEIESVALQLSGIRHAVASVVKIGNSEHLCLYIESADAASPVEKNVVREWLSRKLTYYMVPDVYVLLSSIPLNANGKIDRRALPQPTVSDISQQQQIVAPSTERERLMLNAVTDVCRISPVGVTTDLVAMGLTSLDMMRLLLEWRNRSLCNVSVADILRLRTVRAIITHAGTGDSVFRWNNNQPHKPVAVYVCGYGSSMTAPSREAIAMLAQHFSVFVIDTVLQSFRSASEVSFQSLMQLYTERVVQALHGRHLALLTGFCFGSELALHLAQRLNAAYGWKPLVAVFDSVYHRSAVQFDVPESYKDDAVVVSNYAILNTLSSQMPDPQHYVGHTLFFVPAEVSQSKYMDLPYAIMTDAEREEYTLFLSNNRASWQRHYPHSPILQLPGQHMTFLTNPHNQSQVINLISASLHQG